MGNEKIWGPIATEIKRFFINRKYFHKLFDYFVFSSLAILAGYTFSKRSLSFFEIVQLILFFPVVYTTFYLFMSLHDWVVSNYNKKSSSFFSPASNVIDSHALLLMMLIVYIVCVQYLKYCTQLNFNHTVMSLIYLCAFLFFIRRVIRRRSPCHTKEPACNQFSLLKYDAYKHVHMMSATIIAIPFLVGASLVESLNEYPLIAVNASVAYAIYLLTWMVLYQHKYKAEYMLRGKILYLPSIFYPIYPVFFSIYVKTNNTFFYLIFLFSTIIYAMPIIYKSRLKFCDFAKRIINEKYLLAIIYIIVIYFSANNATEKEIVSKFELNVHLVLISSLAVIMAVININKNRREGNSKLNKEKMMYVTMPLFVLVFLHLTIFGLYKFSVLWFPVNDLFFLSSQLNISEWIYLSLFAVYAISLVFLPAKEVTPES